jgi:hypothetical protein
MGGPPSGNAGFDGPLGGGGLSFPAAWPAEIGLSSVSALGPVGGGLPVNDWISVAVD